MKKWILLGLLTLACCFGAAAAEETNILGKPFPEFTAVDTQENTFTLSEQLKNHEAALINIWATWCPPCRSEMPYLNEAFEEFGDRVAFIALSSEVNDTLEKIEAYRRELGLSFPMGRDEASLYRYCGMQGIPITVIVDRFGNAAFFHLGSFFSANEIKRVLSAFLGEGYTESVVLTEIPKDTSTRALPVAEATRVCVENEDAVPVVFHIGSDMQTEAYMVPGDTAHLRLEVATSDNPSGLIFFDGLYNTFFELPDLLDAERGVFVYDVPLPKPGDPIHYTYAGLADPVSGQYLSVVYLIAGEDHVEDFAADILADGVEVTWEYAEAAQPESEAPQAYILHVTDQDGSPVEGLMANFCTDTTCTMTVSDASGLICFEGAPDTYHVQLLMAPEGYCFDEEFEMYVGPAYGEWNLRIKKD